MRTLVSDIGLYEGKEIELSGWVATRRDHGKLIFIDLRDRGGIAQVVFSSKELHEKADMLRSEWVVKIRGIVQKRPQGMVNEKIASGMHEVSATALEIIAESKTPPFDLLDDGRDVAEETRMKYRYLDLRRPRLQENMRTRGAINTFLRNFLVENGFVEIETPNLGKSTPEGARDYLVPSRVYAGKFYALPQSPQQYKQLLMVAGMERYFQLARCFRDEDTRGDRQPEFTQLDIEISFTSQEEILKMVEEMYVKLVQVYYPKKKIQQTPFPRLTYKEVMEKYNSDKPDLRKDKNDPDELAFAFVVDFPMFEWKETEKRWDAVHHPFTKMSGFARSREERQKMNDSKREDIIEMMKMAPGEILAYQYDVVLNGFEVGGGSIRETNPEVLQSVFEFMGNKKEEVEERFGHLLEAFQYGVPPHGGIALGLDRFYAILFNEPNIREVIAFPKTGDGRDLLMGAPDEVRPEQLKELGVEIKKK